MDDPCGGKDLLNICASIGTSISKMPDGVTQSCMIFKVEDVE